ncbi:MAG: GAF domain-containing protein [Armatimonadetes bacterium]|nr:GAF domain-containing protein [Armatimonadota bacterium]
MLISPSNVSALQKIAELVSAQGSADEKLEHILKTTLDALELSALAVELTQKSSGQTRTWRAEDAAAGMQSDTAVANERISVPVSAPSGYDAVLIGVGGVCAEDEKAFLKIVSACVGIILENISLAEAVESSNKVARKRMQEIAAIYDIGQNIDPGGDIKLLDMIVAKAAAVMDGQTCSLMLRDPVDGMLVIKASFGLSDTIVRGVKVGLGEGIAGRVAQSGEPMLILDVGSDPRFDRGVQQRSDVSGSMCVPLRNQDGGISGVLNIRRHHPKPPFDEDDLKLFGVFATHAALAISNSDLHTRLHQKIQEMSTISDVLRAINSTLDLEHVLNQILDNITQVVGFNRCCVYLLDSRSGELVLQAQRGYCQNEQIPKTVRFDEGVIGLAARERIPIFSQGPTPQGDSSPFSGQCLVAPIVVRDRSIGVVAVDNCQMDLPVGPQQVDLLATFVSQAGIAVENARLYEAMEEKYAELNALYEQSKGISAACGLDVAAQMLVTTASQMVQSDGVGLLLLEPKRDKLKMQAGFGSLVEASSAIQDSVQDSECVDFARNQRNPVIMTSSSSERQSGPVGAMLNTFAPNDANLMIVPLIAEDTPIGALALVRRHTESFLPGELQLISIVASHAATVLKNAIAYEHKMQQKVLELTALYEFSKRISSAGNLTQALDSILAMVADLVDYDESYIYAVDYESNTASVRASLFRGKTESAPGEEPLDGSSIISWAINERKAIVSPDITHDARFDSLKAKDKPVRSLMSIPLIVQDEVVGVLNVCSYSPNIYTEDNVRVLSIISSQGAAIYKELEALAALTSYTDNILSSIAAGVVTLDYDGVLLTWNIAAEKIVGIRASRIEGMHYEKVLSRLKITEADKALLRQAIGSVSSTGNTYQGYKLAFHPEKRGEMHINLSISQLLNNAGEQLGLVLIFEDITREIKMENEFRRMGELAAIGQLAASIAHELRNPLSSIKGAAQYLSNEYENEEAIVEFLGIIIDEVNGLNKLTTEFLDYGRPLQLELKPISLNTIVEKTLQLMSMNIASNNVTIQDKLDLSIPDIQADEGQLEQVLRNIIINSLQAMPDGGALTVETGRSPDGGAYVSVTDTGSGIAPDKLERIFVPFFTTKTKGTGLGLSVVNKIVENHGGVIEVASELEKGSTFTIVLPHDGVRPPIGLEEIDQTLERRTSSRLRSQNE